MIIFLSTSVHGYTHKQIEALQGFAFRRQSYTRALRAARLPRATYIFSDMDRLGFWELELASRLYRVLKGAGLRVLNNPATAMQRFTMLRELHARGINRFGIWAADDSSRPARYPVFLRTHSAHRGTLSDLLHDEGSVQSAIQTAIGQGIPMRELVLIEYCAQPINGNLFRKLSTYRVGDRMVSTLCVHERHWAAKYGELGVADQALYDEEYQIIENNTYGEPLRQAFDVASIEYGRSDFALVDHQPQVYEINTNPMYDRVDEHPFAIRVRASQLFDQRYEQALQAIDTPEGGKPVEIDDEQLVLQRRRDRWVIKTRWTP